MEKRYCIYCNRPLVKIGCERINRPSSHSDWETRKYHKKCYSIQMANKNKEFEAKLLLARIESNKLKEERHRQYVEENKRYWNETRLNNVIAFVNKWNNYEDPNDAFLD